MSHHGTSRLIAYPRVMQLDVFDPIAVGDTFDVIRGNGLRKGERMGTGTITGFREDGSPTISVRFDAVEARP